MAIGLLRWYPCEQTRTLLFFCCCSDSTGSSSRPSRQPQHNELLDELVITFGPQSNTINNSLSKVNRVCPPPQPHISLPPPPTNTSVILLSLCPQLFPSQQFTNHLNCHRPIHSFCAQFHLRFVFGTFLLCFFLCFLCCCLDKGSWANLMFLADGCATVETLSQDYHSHDNDIKSSIRWEWCGEGREGGKHQQTIASRRKARSNCTQRFPSLTFCRAFRGNEDPQTTRRFI